VTESESIMSMLANREIQVVLVIAITAIGTYALRVSGLLLSEKIPKTPVFLRLMDTLPGTILLAIVIPPIVEAGEYGAYAVGTTIVCMIMLRNILISMCAGMLIMALLRAGY